MWVPSVGFLPLAPICLAGKHKDAQMDRAWISIVAGVGGFAVSLLSIYLGYLLFLAGATGQFEFMATAPGGTIGLGSIAPGIGFALFGALVAAYTLRKLMGRN